MPLKYQLDSLDDLDESLHSLYKEVDGKYILDADGVVPKNRLDEFRNNNIEHLKKIEALEENLSKFKDVDLDEIKSMREKLDQMENKDHDITDDKLNELLEKRFGRVKRTLEKELETKASQLEDLTGKLQSTQTQLEDFQIFGQIKAAALEAGAKKKALSDIENRARPVWKFENGMPRAYEGEDPLMGNDGPITISEWVGQLKEDYDFLFEASSGGGAAGSLDHETGERVINLNSGNNVIGENLEAFAKGDLRGS